MDLKTVIFLAALLTLALSDWPYTTGSMRPTEEYWTASGSANLAHSLTLAIFPALTYLLYFCF